MSLLYTKNLKTKRDKKQFITIQFMLFLSLFILFIPVIFSLSEADIFPFRNNFLWLCHQKLDRFININGFFPFVCARDLGIFIFILLGSIFPVIRIRGFLFLIIPIFILEKLLEYFFDIPFSNEFRFVLGAGIGLLFASLIQYYSKSYDFPII